MGAGSKAPVGAATAFLGRGEGDLVLVPTRRDGAEGQSGSVVLGGLVAKGDSHQQARASHELSRGRGVCRLVWGQLEEVASPRVSEGTPAPAPAHLWRCAPHGTEPERRLLGRGPHGHQLTR